MSCLSNIFLGSLFCINMLNLSYLINIALVRGFNCMNNNVNNNMNRNQRFYTPTDLRSVLRLLWSQNIMWTRFYIISAMSKLSDIEVVNNRLLENPMDFANVLSIYYGDNVAKEFEDLFREHLILTIKLVNSYIAAGTTTTGNKSTITEVEKKWYENANQLATFLSTINPYWDQQMLQNLFYNHLDMTKDEILKRLNNEYAAEVYLYDFIEYHTQMIAEIMANGIIKQFYS